MNKNNIFSKIFCLFVIFLPLVAWNNYYEGPKLIYFFVGTSCVFIFWIYRILIQKKDVDLNRSDLYFLSWLLTLLISSLLGVHPWESVVGASYRHQGILFFLSLWIIYKTVNLLDIKQKLFLNRGVGVIVVLESVIVFIQYLYGQIYFGKPLGTIGEANAVAGFLAIGSYFVFEYFPNIFFAIPVLAILIEESKSSVLSILPNLLIVFKNLNKKFQKFLSVTILTIGICTIIFISFKPITSPFENRQIIWKLGFAQIITKPLLGFGAESGEVVYDSAFSKHNLPLDGLIIDRAHNLFIDVAMWSGFIGLILFGGFLINRFRGLENKYKKLAFVSFFIYSMFQPLSIVHWIFLFVL